jgi:hypothetical protein
MDEEDFLTTFDYFNSDINLLTIRILLEGFYRGQTIFTLDEFINGNLWKVDEITDEIRDTNDFGSVEDMVLQQVQQILRDLKIGELKQVSVISLGELLEEVIRRAVKTEEYDEELVMYYAAVADEVSKLKKLSDDRVEKEMASGKKYQNITKNRAVFEPYKYFKTIQFISDISAPFIEFEIEFNKKGIKKIHQEIDDLLNGFSENDFKNNLPAYRYSRAYFTKQLEAFYNYVVKLPEIKGSINLPFSILEEKDFEAIKILSHLEKQEIAKVTNWNDTELWKLNFHKTPVTLSMILGTNPADKLPEKSSRNEKLKFSLIFDKETDTLIFLQNEKEIPVKLQGQVQKEVAREIFKNPENIYSKWSLYDISEALGSSDIDTRGVKNAIYNLNKKARLQIPEIKKLFIYDQHSAILNEDYIKKN